MANEVQFIDNTAATTGYWQAWYNNKCTNPLVWNISAVSLQTALEVLCGSGNITVTGDQSSGYTITFGGSLTDINVPQILVVGNVDCASITSSTTTQGTNNYSKNQIWRIDLGGTITGGSLNINDGGFLSSSWSSMRYFSDIQNAFNDVYGSGNTLVTIEVANKTFTVEFIGDYAGVEVPCPQINTTGLSYSMGSMIDPTLVQCSPLTEDYPTTHIFAGVDVADTGIVPVSFSNGDVASPAFTLFGGTYSAYFDGSGPSSLAGSDASLPSGTDEFVMTVRVNTANPADLMLICGWGGQGPGQEAAIHTFSGYWNASTFAEAAQGGGVATSVWQDVAMERIYESGVTTINIRVNGEIHATLTPTYGGGYSPALGGSTGYILGNDSYNQPFTGFMREVQIFTGRKSENWWAYQRNNPSYYSVQLVQTAEPLIDIMDYSPVVAFLPGFGMFDDAYCTNFVTTQGTTVAAWKSPINNTIMVGSPTGTINKNGIKFTGTEGYSTTLTGPPQGYDERTMFMSFQKSDNNWSSYFWIAGYGTNGVDTNFVVQYTPTGTGFNHVYDFDYNYSAA